MILPCCYYPKQSRVNVKERYLSSSKIKLVEWSAPLTRNENIVGEEKKVDLVQNLNQPVDPPFFALTLRQVRCVIAGMFTSS